MAFAAIQPIQVNLSFNYSDGLKSQKVGPVRDLSGAAVDLTTWDSFTMLGVSRSADLSGAFPNGISTATAQITANADGTLDIEMRTADLVSGALAGSYQVVLKGKPTSGDTAQVVGTGNISLGL
jgi:hypothetical protein